MKQDTIKRKNAIKSVQQIVEDEAMIERLCQIRTEGRKALDHGCLI